MSDSPTRSSPFSRLKLKRPHRQGRTQGFFRGEGGGGKIIYNIRWEKQARARRARAGGRCGRGEGAFAFLRLKLNDLVHTLGGIFGKFSIKKVRRKYIFMENVCYLH